MTGRRFPPPWTVDERREGFIVRDATGQALAYLYFEDKPARQISRKRLNRDEARRIAANITKLPKLLHHRSMPRKKWPAGSSDQRMMSDTAPNFELIDTRGEISGIFRLRLGKDRDDPMPFHSNADAAICGARNGKSPPLVLKKFRNTLSTMPVVKDEGSIV